MAELKQNEFADLITRSYEKHMLSAGLTAEQVAMVHLRVAGDLILRLIGK